MEIWTNSFRIPQKAFGGRRPAVALLISHHEQGG